MLYRFLLIILVIDAFVLVGAILLQAGKGTGLAANFGGASSSPDAFIGIRQAGTLLTKATWWCGGIFLGLSFVLQVMSTRSSAPKSVLEGTFTPPPATAPITSPGNAAPAVPLEPVPGTTAPSTSAPGTNAPATTPATIPPPATKR
jgi:preprotein translocase subunit SecG